MEGQSVAARIPSPISPHRGSSTCRGFARQRERDAVTSPTDTKPLRPPATWTSSNIGSFFIFRVQPKSRALLHVAHRQSASYISVSLYYEYMRFHSRDKTTIAVLSGVDTRWKQTDVLICLSLPRLLLLTYIQTLIILLQSSISPLLLFFCFWNTRSAIFLFAKNKLNEKCFALSSLLCRRERRPGQNGSGVHFLGVYANVRKWKMFVNTRCHFTSYYDLILGNAMLDIYQKYDKWREVIMCKNYLKLHTFAQWQWIQWLCMWGFARGD